MNEQNLNTILSEMTDELSYCTSNDSHYGSVAMDSIQEMLAMIKEMNNAGGTSGGSSTQRGPTRPDVQQIQF